MGICCSHKHIVIAPDLQCSVDSLLKNRIVGTCNKGNYEGVISEFSSIVKRQFENSINLELVEDNPLSLPQFEFMMKSQLDKLSSRYKELFLKEEKGQSIHYDLIAQSLQKLLQNCKAQEAIFRITNDLNSLEYTEKLKLTLLDE